MGTLRTYTPFLKLVRQDTRQTSAVTLAGVSVFMLFALLGAKRGGKPVLTVLVIFTVSGPEVTNWFDEFCFGIGPKI